MFIVLILLGKEKGKMNRMGSGNLNIIIINSGAYARPPLYEEEGGKGLPSGLRLLKCIRCA